MSDPRNLYPSTTVFASVRCVHESFRLVPEPIVRRIVDFCFAVISTRYRNAFGMEFYEYEFLSTHYHLVANNACGRITDFLRDFNALLARELNALRGTSGAFFDRAPSIQTVLGDDKVFAHCVYTLANAVAAGLVHKTRHWKGSNSLRFEYGKEYVVAKPHVGLWSKKRRHAMRRSSKRSGRAAYAGRSTLPDTAVIKLDRPPIMPELSDPELRARIREALRAEEARIAQARNGKPVLGMKAAQRIHWSTVPRTGEELFGLNPTLSTATVEQRIAMKTLRVEFLKAYAEALARFNAGERDVVFPAGTVHMRLRYHVETEPIPRCFRPARPGRRRRDVRKASGSSSTCAGCVQDVASRPWPRRPGAPDPHGQVERARKAPPDHRPTDPTSADTTVSTQLRVRLRRLGVQRSGPTAIPRRRRRSSPRFERP